MKKLEPVKRLKKTPVMVFLDDEILKAVKVLGGTKAATGMNNIMESFREEIMEAAKKAGRK